MDGDGYRVDARQLRRPRKGGRRLRGIDAELVFAFAGGNFLMRLCVNVRVDTNGDIYGHALGCRDLAQGFQFRQRFHVHLHNAAIQGEGQFGSGLADAGKHDPVGRDAAGQRLAQFALRHHIGARTEVGEGANHAQIGVCLQGIADRGLLIGEGLGEHLVMALQRGCRIAIEGRAHRFGDAGQRDVLDMQFAVYILKMIHCDFGYCLGNVLFSGSGGFGLPFFPQAEIATAAARPDNSKRSPRRVTGIASLPPPRP